MYKYLFVFLILPNVLMGQEKMNHELQIGIYLGQGAGPGVGAKYKYVLNNYLTATGGVLVYKYVYKDVNFPFFDSYPPDMPLWAQTSGHMPASPIELGNDDFELGISNTRNWIGDQEFVFEPEIGIEFNTPRIFRNLFSLSIEYSLRLEFHSVVMTAEESGFNWYEPGSDTPVLRAYVINYYERRVGPIGFNFQPTIRWHFSENSSLGIHMYLHGLSSRSLIEAMINPFDIPYGSIGIAISTRF